MEPANGTETGWKMETCIQEVIGSDEILSCMSVQLTLHELCLLCVKPAEVSHFREISISRRSGFVSCVHRWPMVPDSLKAKMYSIIHGYIPIRSPA